MGIVVLGSVFVDIKGYPLGSYIPGGRNAGRVEYVHGGVSRNIAEDVGNLGLHPAFVSLVDSSGIAHDVLSRLEEHGVSTRWIRRVPDGMGTWLAVFDNNNDVCASISRRPDLLPILDTLRESGEDIFAHADSVFLELDMEQEIISEVFRLAARHGTPVYAAVSNMSIAMERREFFQLLSGFVCNQGEAEMLFSTAFSAGTPDGLSEQLAACVAAARIPAMVVTLGSIGAVWADQQGRHGVCNALDVQVMDTTGAGDAFFAGVAVGLTYGKSLAASCDIGTRLAASVIRSTENTCPRFLPEEFGITLPSAQPSD